MCLNCAIISSILENDFSQKIIFCYNMGIIAYSPENYGQK